MKKKREPLLLVAGYDSGSSNGGFCVWRDYAEEVLCSRLRILLAGLFFREYNYITNI